MIKLIYNRKEKLTRKLESAIGKYESSKQVGRWHVWRFGGLDYVFDTTLLDFANAELYPEHGIEIWICTAADRGFICGVWGEWHPDFQDETTYLATWKTLRRRRFSDGSNLNTVRVNPYKIEVQPFDTLVSKLWASVCSPAAVVSTK